MATETKRDQDDQSGPDDNGQDLKLNLSFSSIEDLVNEMKTRCKAMVIAWAVPSKSHEDDEDYGGDDDGLYIATMYKGSTATCLGMATGMQRDLIKNWENI